MEILWPMRHVICTFYYNGVTLSANCSIDDRDHGNVMCISLS